MSPWLSASRGVWSWPPSPRGTSGTRLSPSEVGFTDNDCHKNCYFFAEQIGLPVTRAASTRGTPPCITPTKANAAWGLAGMSSSGTARRYGGKSPIASSEGISYLGFFLLKNIIGAEVSSFFEYSSVDSHDECIYLMDSSGRGMGPYDTYCSYDCKVICMCDGTASGESESRIESLFSPLFTFHCFSSRRRVVRVDRQRLLLPLRRRHLHQEQVLQQPLPCQRGSIVRGGRRWERSRD